MIEVQKKYQVITLRNFREVEKIRNHLTEEQMHAIEVVGNVLPFKINNYVIDELIDWNNIPEDPIFQLTFPQKGMLSDFFYKTMEDALSLDLSKAELKKVADGIRYQLNPNPSGQEKNTATLEDQDLRGIQHKYKETALFFPSSGQTCHAYCTFCFRWSQFVGMEDLKFAMKESELLVNYLNENPSITDVIFTGGDPMVMSTQKLETYINPLLESRPGNLQNIRLGSKALGYWPYKFLTDKDADDTLRLFERIVNSGFHLTLMAHFNHPNELESEAVQYAIKRILKTGVQIRTQAPILTHINDNAKAWADMWKKQVSLGLIPYYMFVARDTGAQEYFAVTLERALAIYKKAYQNVSGLARTVKGPSMSTDYGKIEVLGINEINNEKVFTLRFIQARNPEWVKEPFFAKYNPDAVWISDLEPAFGGEKFFFQ
ncbi:lysine 2,3-aminomutase [Aureisphaera galaxeae]|uniref:KamA family radical SAM protein n=1 Tax=Aureisphaera galaxeae TaxID=1538023 RepID=UPI002350EFCA|nr:lysine 2,3-aminomutase [Aureisphaera galaxeae]MDC8004734.1 lysine 2,3-aminomutase [Aureisphaera galaxeae]